MASTNGLPVPALSSANNPPADFLALANAVDATYGGSVANWAALPATGNFKGKRLWVTDISVVATWNGTAWVQALPVSSTGISAADKALVQDALGVGLVNVVPTSVAQAGGSASANAQGLVTFTGVTSLSLNGAFTSAYKNYRVIFDGSTGSGVAMHCRLRASGTDNTTTNYFTALYKTDSGGASAVYTLSGQTYFNIGQGNTGFNVRSSFDISAPQLAVGTRVNAQTAGHTGTNSAAYDGALAFNGTTQFDGITFYPASGSTSGTVQLFAYND